jgi:hypothetical protein
VSVGETADALECKRADRLRLLTVFAVFAVFREREKEMVVKGKW